MSLVTLAEIKTWLGITDNSQDAILTMLQEGVEAAIIDFCECDFTEKTVTNEVHDGVRNDTVVPRNFPITTVQAIRLGTSANGTGGSTIDAANYTVQQWGVVLQSDYTPQGRSYVGIDYKWGYTSVPANVKMAVYTGVEAWKRRHDKKTLGSAGMNSMTKDRESVSYTGDSGPGGTKWDEKTGLPKEVIAMISNYRHLEFPGGETSTRNR